MTHKILHAVQFIHLFLFALVLGVFWGTWFSLSRSIASITPGTFLEVGHLMIANLGAPMAVLMPATLLSALPVLVMLFRLHQRRAFYLTLGGVGLLVGALIITLTVNVPIDDEINQWTVNSLPTSWTIERDRWQLYHTIRTFTCMAGFACAIAAVLWGADTGHQQPARLNTPHG
jgi:uncharacterized membrane protein